MFVEHASSHLPILHLSQCVIFPFPGAFEDEDVTHVDGDVNPVRDLGTIFEELRLKDVAFLRDKTADLEKKVTRGGDKKGVAEYVSTLLKH